MTLLDMENKECILSALKVLENDSNGAIPPILEEYLREIAKHGLTFIPWIYIKPLILLKFNRVMDKFIEEVDVNFYPKMLCPVEMNDLREQVFKILSHLEGTPFTIQRLCELLILPRKQYTRPDKFLRGFEKVCLVVSTIDCYGNKIHNVDPKLSGAIEDLSSSVQNGSSTEYESNSSIECSSGEHKRSDDEDEDMDENYSAPNGSPASSRKPCINFYRPITTNLTPPSESLQKSIGETILGAHSPGIPGKHTLQRPYLRRVATLVPNFRQVQNKLNQENEERVKFDEGESSSCIPSIQKLFSEPSIEQDAKSSITPTSVVPSINEMLRPMGQLEAFVNTISMDVASTSTVSVASTPALVESSPQLIGEFVDEVQEVQLTPNDNGINIDNEIIPVREAEIDTKPVSEASSRASLKRDSPVFADNDSLPDQSIDLAASPAKRPRIADSDEVDIQSDIISPHNLKECSAEEAPLEFVRGKSPTGHVILNDTEETGKSEGDFSRDDQMDDPVPTELKSCPEDMDVKDIALL